MLIIILTAALAAWFIAVSLKSSGLRPEDRSQKAVKPLSNIISFSPLLGLAVFAVLFAFVLKGRLMERAAHALMVFVLWMYAARFYQYILSHYKNRAILAASAAGMLLSAALAVLLTPLDRYAVLIYSLTGWYSLFIGCALLAVFYIIEIFKTHKEDCK